MAKERVADGIPVFCAHTGLVETSKLRPYPRNPNTHPEGQIRLLATIIGAQGWRHPIVVSNRSGYVVKGHGRRLAALMLGVSHVPVDRQDYADEESERADMLADNRLAELSELDMREVRDLLEELDTGAIDMELTGYDMEALEALLGSDGFGADEGADDDPSEGSQEPRYDILVTCLDAEHQRAVYERLLDEGLSVKVVS